MPEVLVTDDDGVRTVVLNRPESLNAMTDGVFDGLRRAMVAAASDSAVRCVVLSGAGGGFCAGIDLKDFAPDRRYDDGEPHGFVPCIEEIERFPKPLVAAVNGVAVGFGTTVLLHCDIVLASSQARFQLPFVHLGLGPEAGSSFLLPARVGHQTAAHLLYTGRWVEADEAAAIGLVWTVVEPLKLMTRAAALAADIAAAPLQALIATKKNLVGARVEAVRAARARELDSYGRLLQGDSYRDAVAAFRRRSS